MGLLPRRLLPLSLSKPARPQGPAGAPPCPGVLPRGHRCSQSRVCLAWEPCPWLHNSQNGIRPRVFLNRATKSASSPWAAARGPRLLKGQMETLSGVTGPPWGGLGHQSGTKPRPFLGRRKGRSPRVGISLSLVAVEAPKLPLPHVPLQALRNVSKITDRISKGSKD